MTPFKTQRDAALALLNSDAKLSRKTGSFAGQLCADDTPMTPRQIEWLAGLLIRAELPELEGI